MSGAVAARAGDGASRLSRPVGRKLAACIASLALFAGQVFAGGANTPPHAPSRSPDSSPSCQRKDAPRWLDFYCRFMTVRLWEAAGRPDFIAPDGSRWQPWFYGDLDNLDNNLLYEGYPYRRARAGFLEAMLQRGKLPDEYDPAYVARFWSMFRYTPWSVYFEREAGCGRGQIANPRDFTAASGMRDKFPRARLLGLGWKEVDKDSSDPTRGLGTTAMEKLMNLAERGGGDFESPMERTGASGSRPRPCLDARIGGSRRSGPAAVSKGH